MTDIEHTPGPWHVTEPSGNYIRSETGGIAGLTFSATKADARLIAAAPDMLEALEKVQDWLSGCSTRQAVQQYVTSAIAKAKGEQ